MFLGLSEGGLPEEEGPSQCRWLEETMVYSQREEPCLLQEGEQEERWGGGERERERERVGEREGREREREGERGREREREGGVYSWVLFSTHRTFLRSARSWLR